MVVEGGVGFGAAAEEAFVGSVAVVSVAGAMGVTGAVGSAGVVARGVGREAARVAFFRSFRTIRRAASRASGWALDGWALDGWALDGWALDGWALDGWALDGWALDGWALDGWVLGGWALGALSCVGSFASDANVGVGAGGAGGACMNGEGDGRWEKDAASSDCDAGGVSVWAGTVWRNGEAGAMGGLDHIGSESVGALVSVLVSSVVSGSVASKKDSSACWSRKRDCSRSRSSRGSARRRRERAVARANSWPTR